MTDRERITRLAEGVMGWKIHPRNTAHWVDTETITGNGYAVRGWTPDCSDPWNPLTSIADAFELVEKLCSLGWTPTLAIRPFEKYPQDRHIFHGCMFEDGKRLKSFSGRAETAPAAICEAALAVLDAREAQ